MTKTKMTIQQQQNVFRKFKWNRIFYISIRVALLTPNLTNITKITYLQAEIDSSMPAELEKCNETPKKICIDSKFCTLICNIDRPVKSFRVNFQGCNLVRSLRILIEFDKTSQIHEISKYCKNIGMQKSTFGKCSIFL